MARKVLVIDQDFECREILQRLLERDGYRVFFATTEQDGLQFAYEVQPDLIILDILLPESRVNGFDICAQLREVTDIPILILSKQKTESALIRGFEVGADDYVKKPFGGDELLARVRALIRRRTIYAQEKKKASNLTCYSDGVLELDFENQVVCLSGKEVHLTPTEFKLLAHLVRYPKQVLSQRALLMDVWDGGNRDEGLVSLYIHQLRQKLKTDGDEHKYINTQWGQGYWFNPRSRDQTHVLEQDDVEQSMDENIVSSSATRKILWPVLILFLILIAQQMGRAYGLLPRPDAEQISITMSVGSQTVAYNEAGIFLKAEKTVETFRADDLYGARGEICVTNNGKQATENLEIVNVIRVNFGDDEFDDYLHAPVDLESKPIINSGETHCYPYETVFKPLPYENLNYQLRTCVRITNHVGWLPGGDHCLGTSLCPFGPDLKSELELKQ